MHLCYHKLSRKEFASRFRLVWISNSNCADSYSIGVPIADFCCKRDYHTYNLVQPASEITFNIQSVNKLFRRYSSGHHQSQKFSSGESYSILQSSSLQPWFKNRQELRKYKLTASTFAAAVGFWRHRRVQLWLEKIGAIEPFSGNLATCWRLGAISKKKKLWKGAAMNDDMPSKDQNLRFVEDSPVMRFIQAMDVFQSIPQEPHFRPLAACEEVCREGLALGHMMTFVNVAKKISTLGACAPRTDFDSLFKCLSELELHGFNVEAVRSRLLVLQSLKDSEEQLNTKSVKIKSEIIEQTHERSKVKAELDEVIKDLKLLEDKKREMEEKKARLITMNNENDSEIAKLKSGVGSFFEEIKKVDKEFKSVAASPWKK